METSLWPGSKMQCDCKPEINFSVQFADFKMVDIKSHEYQFMGFIYACVMLLNYFSLTTFIMVKLMLFKPPRAPLNLEMEESKKANEDMLKTFREKEKKMNEDFEREARRQVKLQMVNYLKSMQTLPAFTGGLLQSTSVVTTVSEEAEEAQSTTRLGSEEQEEEDVEDDDSEIWKKEQDDWERTCERRYERRMAVSYGESEGDDDSLTEYFL